MLVKFGLNFFSEACNADIESNVAQRICATVERVQTRTTQNVS